MIISKMAVAAFLLFFTGFIYAAENENSEFVLVNMPCPKQLAVSVSVSAEGTVLFNGKAMPMDDLGQALTKLPGTVKEVCYSTANPPTSALRSIAMQALDKIMATRFAISFYLDAGFQKRVVFK